MQKKYMRMPKRPKRLLYRRLNAAIFVSAHNVAGAFICPMPVARLGLNGNVRCNTVPNIQTVKSSEQVCLLTNSGRVGRLL